MSKKDHFIDINWAELNVLDTEQYQELLEKE